MKVIRLLLVSLIILLALPIVNAEIKLSPLSSSVYNWGDRILVDGQVTYSGDVRATLNLVLSCDGTNAQVAAVLLNLKTNQPASFSTFLVLPNSLLGDCRFSTTLVDNSGLVLESAEFSAFKLVNELKGTFDLNNQNFQLGDRLLISGTLTKQNNELIGGLAAVYFKQGINTLFLDTIEINNGVLSFSKSFSNVPTGNYIIDISATVNFGNRKNFEQIFTFNVSGGILINPALDKNIYSPGDTLNLNGYVVSSLNKELKNVNVEFNFENTISNRKLSTSSETFATSYLIPSKIKTGSHEINLIATDSEGNYGKIGMNFSVRAVPTVLSLNLNEGSYYPDQNLGFTVILLDQASDPMQENINVYLINLNDDVVDSEVVAAGTESSIHIPTKAAPGTWKLKVDGLGLSSEAVLNVKEDKRVNASVDGTNLIIENVGNVPYIGALEILGNNLSKIKNIDLGVGEKQNIKLDKIFSSGYYNITLPSLGSYFEDVVIPESKSFFNGFGAITSNAAKNADSPGRSWFLFIALIIICCGVIYLIIGRRKGKDNFDFNSNKDFKLGRKKLDELKAKGIRKDRPTEYGKATQADIEDWKKRVQQSYKEQETKRSEQ